MALGYYIPVGYYVDWDDRLTYGTGSISADLFQELGIMTTNVSISKQIHPRLSLGAGVNLLYGMIDYEANKGVANSGISDYAWSFDSESNGTGWEGVVGLLYHITDDLSLGGVYRSGGTIDLEGDVQTSSSSQLFPYSLASGFQQGFRQPSTYGVGLAYQVRPDWTVTADWQHTRWSEFRIDIDYDTPGAVLANQDYSALWSNSNRYRFGTEWLPCPQWALRGGYFFDESPLPDQSVSLSHIVGVDRHNLTLGVGRKIGRHLSLDGLLAYAFGNRTVSGVDYGQDVYAVGLTLAYRR